MSSKPNLEKGWKKQTILDLRSWGFNKLADLLAKELEEERENVNA